MQYDPNENVGTSGSSFGNANDTSSVGSTGPASETTSGSASTASTGTGLSSGDTGYRRDQTTGGKAREKASQLKATLADKLEHGAQRIRDRAASHQSGQQTGAAGTPAYRESTPKIDRTLDRTLDRRLDRASESLAHGMESTANWVRNADLDKMKGDVEKQVRANPGRALLVAVGLGYLLGKVLRGGRPRT